MKWFFTVVAFFVFIFSWNSTLLSLTKPDPGEAHRVIDFYYYGKGEGVVLADAKICRGIHDSGAAKYDCKNEVIEIGPLKEDGSPPDIFYTIKLGEPIYVWMLYLVPQGAEEEVFVQFHHDGETEYQSGELTVKGSLRYRTWTRYTPDKPGDWKIEIYHMAETGPQLLSTFDLSVL